MIDPIPATGMEMSMLSPLDGRYRSITAPIIDFMGDDALMLARIHVEISYFNALCLFLGIDDHIYEITELTPDDIAYIKDTETVTRHDIKAIEYFVKHRYGKGKHEELIHFGLTSQDINNTAIPMMLKKTIKYVLVPKVMSISHLLSSYGDAWYSIPMLSHTHGQPATPTRVGKVFLVFKERLDRQLAYLLDDSLYSGKFGGATGGLNAHHVAYPSYDWETFCDQFLQSLGLRRQHHTTQIEHYDDIAYIMDCMKRICTIIINLCVDMWLYISMGYFKLKVVDGEVGSSAMPHKINPIDFENAEGNAKIAISLLEFLSNSLPASRMQRDLTDSTKIRNLGVSLGHVMVAMESLHMGMGRIDIDTDTISSDLEQHWEVVAEAVQTILRREGYLMPYEALKELTRGRKVSKDDIHTFIRSLSVSSHVQDELLRITPHTYIGI